MYIPPSFREERPEVLREVIRRYSFAALVTGAGGEMVATHLPLLLEEGGVHGVLIGHLACANEQWRSFKAGSEALAIFGGPHGYVSPSWYEAERAVPTWNYVAVHAYGVPAVVEDPAEVRRYLERLVHTYESGRDEPWEMERLSEEYVNGLARGIVAFRMPIRRVEGKLKLSQNRSTADRAGVVSALTASPDPTDRALAEWMREVQPQMNNGRAAVGAPVV